jgi:hypothetical protein
MATTFTSRQRREREDAVLDMLNRGKGVVDIAERFSITKQAVWQFLSVRGWLERAKANDAVAREKRKLSRQKSRKSIKSGLDVSSGAA